MDWVKLLTEFEGNPKVLAVGLAGAGLYARALAYSGRYETDGFIPESWVHQAVACEDLHELPKQMLSNGLWEKAETDGNGYVIRDYLEVNRSKEEMDSLRQSRILAGKRGGKAKAKQNKSKSPSYSYSLSGEFSKWLDHYRETTGKRTVRGSKPAREAFAARRREGYSLEDLKLATVGCHGDDFCREHGYDTPDTILRASKVERYIQLASKPARPKGSPGMANAHRLADKAREMEAREAAG